MSLTCIEFIMELRKTKGKILAEIHAAHDVYYVAVNKEDLISCLPSTFDPSPFKLTIDRLGGHLHYLEKVE